MKNKINRKISLMLVLSILLLSLTMVNVNATSYANLYSFDRNCYDALCKDNPSIFDNEKNQCIYEPIFNSNTILGSIKRDVSNIEEFLELDYSSRNVVKDIYLNCIERNTSAERENIENKKSSYGPILESFLIGKALIAFCVVLFIQGIILFYLLRKIIKKKKAHMKILLATFFIFSGLIGLLILGKLGTLFYLPSLSKSLVPFFCSTTYETYTGYCQPFILIFPYYVISLLFQIIIFIIFKKNEKPIYT